MKLLSLFFFFIISVVTSAQNAFTKAVIYKTDGNKIDCYIKNITDESTQQVFEYAMQPGGATTKIDAASLTKVEFTDGMILEKHPIEIYVISTKAITRRQSDYEFPENKFTAPVMVEKLISGTHSLYQFVDKYAFSHFFYTLSGGTSLERLVYKEYVSDNGEIINKREFRSQIQFLASNTGCEKKMEPLIGRTEYKLSNMITVFKGLNECAGEKSVVNNKYLRTKPVIRLTVNGGLSATNLTIPDPSPSIYPGLTAEAFSSSIGPLFGASVELVPQKRQKNYIVSLDLLYHSYSAKTDSLRPNSYITGIGKFKFTALSASPVVRFRLTKSKVAPFVELGFSIRTLSKKEDNYYYRNSIANTQTNKEIFYGKSNTIGYLGGVGIDLKRISFHARYTMPANRSTVHYSTIFIMAKFAILGKDE
jgi:hypothetical protein